MVMNVHDLRSLFIHTNQCLGPEKSIQHIANRQLFAEQILSIKSILHFGRVSISKKENSKL